MRGSPAQLWSCPGSTCTASALHSWSDVEGFPSPGPGELAEEGYTHPAGKAFSDAPDSGTVSGGHEQRA